MTQLIGPELIRLAESFDHVSSFGFLVEDTSRGSVREVMGQPVIQYWLHRAGRLAHQARRSTCSRRSSSPPAPGASTRRSPASTCSTRPTISTRSAARRSAPWDLDLSAYHPLGTARMGTRSGELGGRAGPPASTTREALYVVDGAAVPIVARRQPADHDHGARDARGREDRRRAGIAARARAWYRSRRASRAPAGSSCTRRSARPSSSCRSGVGTCRRSGR